MSKKDLDYTPPPPTVVSSRQEGEVNFYVVQTQHDGIAARLRGAVNICRGLVVAEFSTLDRGTRDFNCNDCGLTASVSIDVLMLELGRLSETLKARSLVKDTERG